ncbi:MAG: DMT family transporter [Clostridia bacterium]|nr:DMT family transporter [Clostridia bacterium]
MSYFYLILAVLLSAAMSVAGMFYEKNTAGKRNVSTLFNCMIAASNAICWGILYIFDFTFHPYVLSYSAVYGICLALFFTGLTGGIKHGSASVTSFFKQVAFVLVSVWGFFFWKEPVTPVVIVGIVLIVIALLLCLLEPKPKNGGPKKTSVIWVLFLLLLLVSNAACNIVQRTQQIEFYHRHGSQLMFFAALFALVATVLLSLKDDKSEWKETVEENWHIGLASGVCCALANVFFILMAQTKLSTSFIYPVLAIGGVALSTLASVLLFKERLRPLQWIGLGIGAVAVFLLS